MAAREKAQIRAVHSNLCLTICVRCSFRLASTEADRTTREGAIHKWKERKDPVATGSVPARSLVMHQGNSCTSHTSVKLPFITQRSLTYDGRIVMDISCLTWRCVTIYADLVSEGQHYEQAGLVLHAYLDHCMWDGRAWKCISATSSIGTRRGANEEIDKRGKTGSCMCSAAKQYDACP